MHDSTTDLLDAVRGTLLNCSNINIKQTHRTNATVSPDVMTLGAYFLFFVLLLMLAGFSDLDATFFVLLTFRTLASDAVSVCFSFVAAVVLTLHSTTIAPDAIFPNLSNCLSLLSLVFRS